jgi:hypothetical protein
VEGGLRLPGRRRNGSRLGGYRWWDRLGFHPFDPDDPASFDLYLLTAGIEATLAAMR